MRRFIFLFIVCAFLFLSCGVVRVTGEFDSKYEFFLKTKLYPKFFFTDTIGMRDYKDLSIIDCKNDNSVVVNKNVILTILKNFKW